MADIDYLNMSDEELANVAPPDVVQEDVSFEKSEEPVVEDAGSGETTEEPQAQEEEQVTEVVEDEGSSSEVAEGSQESNLEQKEGEPKSEEDVPDYKAQLDRILTPFKANGKEIAVKSVDDAISLMQMGANYNKKMAALKPNLKLMKMLENNGLLSEERIGFLIDLEKRNPEAINKLVKESGLDPLELDAEKAGDYKPNSYAVDDRELELDAVLDELSSSPTYNQTLGIVSNKWDGASKQVIANSPQLLKVINSHVETGIYDLISKEIESERMFGRLDGLSDIEAYRRVGDAIQARGGFNHLAPQPKETPVPKQVIQPKPKQVDDDKLREKKRAASSTKSAGSNQVAQDYNPLALSDEAFSKLINDKYL